MRVLLLTTYFPKPTNPLIGTWALEQAQGLRQAGLEVEVVSLTSHVPNIVARSPGAKAWATCPPEHYWEGLRVHYPRWLYYEVKPLSNWAFADPWPQVEIGWLSTRRWLRQFVEDYRPDIIFAHHTVKSGFVAFRLHQLCQIPYVTMDHDFSEITQSARLPKRRRLYESITRNAAIVVAVAVRAEAALRKQFPGIKTCTIHNGVRDIPAEFRMRQRPPQLEGKTVIFSAGFFYSRKGFPFLVRAFARVANRYPDSILRIAGDGDDRREIEGVIRELKLENRVQLLGKLPRSQILQEMVWADLFALLGWDEPFATVYIEAMAAGILVLCANDGGINDVLVDGVHGRSVPPQDANAAAGALAEILSDAKGRRRMGEAARALFLDRLTTDINGKALKRVFERAIRTTEKAWERHI